MKNNVTGRKQRGNSQECGGSLWALQSGEYLAKREFPKTMKKRLNLIFKSASEGKGDVELTSGRKVAYSPLDYLRNRWVAPPWINRECLMMRRFLYLGPSAVRSH